MAAGGALHAQETPAPAPSAPAPTAPAPAQNTTPAAPASTPPLRLESLPPDPTTPTPEQARQLRQQRLMQAASQLVRNEAHWGPLTSTPGTVLSMKEVSRQSTPQGAEITYTLSASGFAPGDSLKLLRWPLDGNLQLVTDGLTVDGLGQVICPSLTKGDCLKTVPPGAAVKITTTASEGEAIRVAVADDARKHAATYVVPFAVSASDHGCELEMLLGIKNAGLVLVEGHGFPANTPVELDSSSYGEKRQIKTTTDANGSLAVGILPGVSNHPTGQTTVHYSGATCSPTLTFNWGEGTYKPHP
jgi:hypothetical protein